MASDVTPAGEEEEQVRRKRRRRRKAAELCEGQTAAAADIEELTCQGHRALQAGRRDGALSCFRNALKAAEELRDSRVLAVCSFNLGAAYVEAGRPQKGLDFLRRSQPGPKAQRLPDLQFNLALAHNALGQSREAAAYFLQAAQLYRSQGDGGSEGDACMEMSRCHSRDQDWSLAVRGFLRAAESYRVAAMLDSAAAALREAGSHMIQSDQFSHDDVTGVLRECLSLTDSITDPRTLGELYLSVGVSYCQLRRFEEAVACFQRALGPASQRPRLLANVLHNLGAALNSVGRFTAAASYHRLAAGLYGSLGCRGDQARCFSNLALACSRLGEDEEAAESFILALQGFRDTGDHGAQVQVCESLADCYLKQRKQQKAVQLYREALTALSHCQESSGPGSGSGSDSGPGSGSGSGPGSGPGPGPGPGPGSGPGSGSVRDRLVERLTAALQRPRPLRPRPHSPPVQQHVRKSDITGTASNQQADRRKGAGPEQEAAEDCGSAGGGATETPALHSSEQQPDSDASLAQEAEAPPPAAPLSRWRSRFCSLM